jgi:hypothetical protein
MAYMHHEGRRNVQNLKLFAVFLCSFHVLQTEYRGKLNLPPSSNCPIDPRRGGFHVMKQADEQSYSDEFDTNNGARQPASITGLCPA